MKRSSGEAIDSLYGQLKALSADAKYGFGMYRTDWGKVNSESWNRLLVGFCKSIRELAKDCPVKYFAGAFYTFNGKIYEVVEPIVVEQAYQLLIEDLFIAPVLGRSTIRKESFIDTIKNYNVLVPQFDVVAFANGVVDFGLARVAPSAMPFSPHYHVTYYHPYNFDPKAKCKKWERFLLDVLPDKDSRDILQMFMGLGLVQRGDAYNPYEGKMSDKIELCLMLIGSGANGKSVIFEVMCALFGKDRISKMDYAELTADGDEGMRGRYPIRNAIFNWSSDSDPKKFGRKNTGMFKRLVSGEPVPYRKLGENVLESKSLPYLIFNLNELPFPEDVTLGFIRRLQYVSFDVTIPKEKQNPRLAAEIIKEELSGVFNWVLKGERMLRERKFQFPSAEGSRKQLILSYLGTQPVLAWLKAYEIRCDKGAKGEIPVWVNAKTLYDSFRQFCEDNNLEEKEIPSQQKFGRVMWNSCKFYKKRTPSGVIYEIYGITEADLAEHFLISNMKSAEETQEYSFIKDDLPAKKEE